MLCCDGARCILVCICLLNFMGTIIKKMHSGRLTSLENLVVVSGLSALNISICLLL